LYCSSGKLAAALASYKYTVLTKLVLKYALNLANIGSEMLGFGLEYRHFG